MGSFRVAPVAEHHTAAANADLALLAVGHGLVVLIAAPEGIAALANQRWEAKQARDFATADRLRKELTDSGWKILDRKDGFDLEKIS